MSSCSSQKAPNNTHRHDLSGGALLVPSKLLTASSRVWELF